jgi:hypothetical protein
MIPAGRRLEFEPTRVMRPGKFERLEFEPTRGMRPCKFERLEFEPTRGMRPCKFERLEFELKRGKRPGKFERLEFELTRDMRPGESKFVLKLFARGVIHGPTPFPIKGASSPPLRPATEIDFSSPSSAGFSCSFVDGTRLKDDEPLRDTPLKGLKAGDGRIPDQKKRGD